MQNIPSEADTKVLTVLHSLASTDPAHAKTSGELSWYLKMPEEEVSQILENLNMEGYVQAEGGRYYVTLEGSLRVVSSFS
jgi:DNA-binding IclR family transcriptional regulator